MIREGSYNIMKVSVSKIQFGFLFVLLIFNNIICMWIPFFGYLDEIIALISIAYVLLHLRSVMKKSYNRSIFLCLFLITIIGILGNIIYGYQSFMEAIIKDILAFYKMPITFVAAYHWSENKNLNTAHTSAVAISKISTIIIFAGCMVSLFADIGFSYGIRYGIRTYKFLFSHPTFLVYSLVLISVVLVSEQEKSIERTRRIWLYHIQILICLLFTFRDKAFGYIMLFIVLMLLFPRVKKLKLRYFAIAGLGALGISYEKIMEYQSWSWSQREALYIHGIQLMFKCFPLGSGFGTFNSFLSGKFYSKAYLLFGLDKKPGMNPMDYVDIGDAQLPYYYAQFGLIGFILFLLIIFIIVKCIMNRYSGKK